MMLSTSWQALIQPPFYDFTFLDEHTESVCKKLTFYRRAMSRLQIPLLANKKWGAVTFLHNSLKSIPNWQSHDSTVRFLKRVLTKSTLVAKWFFGWRKKITLILPMDFLFELVRVNYPSSSRQERRSKQLFASLDRSESALLALTA